MSNIEEIEFPELEDVELPPHGRNVELSDDDYEVDDAR